MGKVMLLMSTLLVFANEIAFANDKTMSIDAITTYGPRGAESPSTYSNSESVFITIKCKWFLIPNDRSCNYAISALLTDSESKVIQQMTRVFSERRVISRGAERSTFSSTFVDKLPQDIMPGNYNYRITLENKANNESAHVDLPIEVYPNTFPKLINVAFWQDAEESIPAGSCLNLSETVHLAFDVHDIAMPGGKGDVEVILKLLDSKTRKWVPSTSVYAIRNSIEIHSPRHHQVAFTVDAKGTFWLSCQIIDHTTGQDTTLNVRLSVNDALDLP